MSSLTTDGKELCISTIQTMVCTMKNKGKRPKMFQLDNYVNFDLVCYTRVLFFITFKNQVELKSSRRNVTNVETCSINIHVLKLKVKVADIEINICFEM